MKAVRDLIEELYQNVDNYKMLFEGITILSPKDSYDEISYYNDYNSWVIKINSLIEKTNISITLSLNFSEDEFNTFEYTLNKNMAYYYIENAIFRVNSLWDVLAQVTNLAFNVGKPIDKIHYKTFFNPKETKLDDEHFKEFQNSVYKYIIEKEDHKQVPSKKVIKGNHRFVNRLRNQFTHRNDPHVFSVLNSRNKSANITLPTHPLLELRRVTEDYIKCNEFIGNINKLVANKFKESNPFNS